MIPRVACFALNPGLGNRNSYRVAKDKPHPNLPLGRALKNYRYFHFIGVVRLHYRAFMMRSGYDVW